MTRQRLVDSISSRDRRFAAEIEEYRRQVASIANSPDPRKRDALMRYADGDRKGAFEAMVAIQRAETKAVAAGWREVAALAQDRKDRGEMGTAEVIPLYEEAQKLDPTYAWGWIELGRLYQEVGNLPEARRSGEQALVNSHDDRDRSASGTDLGDVLVASGDLSGGRARYEQSLQIRERLSAANPSSAEAQRDLLVSHMKLGRFPGGDSHWSKALEIALKLQSQGRLAPRDAGIVDALQEWVASNGKTEP